MMDKILETLNKMSVDELQTEQEKLKKKRFKLIDEYNKTKMKIHRLGLMESMLQDVRWEKQGILP